MLGGCWSLQMDPRSLLSALPRSIWMPVLSKAPPGSSNSDVSGRSDPQILMLDLHGFQGFDSTDSGPKF